MRSRSARPAGRIVALMAALPFVVGVLASARSQAATLDVAAGVLTYTAATGIANALVVSLAAVTYTIDDPAEASISLGAGAVAAGCTALDANTISCPKSAVGSWNVQLGDQSDTANLAGVSEPTTIRGGVGGDVVTGGAGSDTFTWQPGEGSDTIDGGPGTDSLAFTGAAVNENYSVTAISGGFQLTRDIAAVTLQAQSVESLNLQTLGGDDTVTTHPLPSTSQTLDGGAQASVDTLSYDASGACTTVGSGTFQSLGGQLVSHAGFETTNLVNQCTVFPATLDISASVLAYTAGNGAANALTVSLAAGSYTIDDTGVPAISLGAGATTAGCTVLDANTVSCPESAVGSWNVQLGDQSDTANLAAVIEPATIRGGVGGDVVTGGAGSDTFTWQPGEGSDTIDGGPGTDSLAFTGAAVNENYSVTAISGGFQLTRDIAAVTLQAQSVESLNLQTLGGDDTVTTHPLPSTSQTLDGGVHAIGDTLSYDAGGACTTVGAGTFQSLGGQLVSHAGFETANLLNQCTIFPATLDISAGLLSYTAGNGAANALFVSLAAGSYTIDDTGVPAISLGAGATTAGCTVLDANTVSCPESAVGSWNVQLGDQNDTANLTAVIEPTTIRGGVGGDVVTGGAGSDAFTWQPGEGSDTIDGGPGTDGLAFTGAVVNEHYAVTAISGGFQLTRDIAAVTLQAQSVEWLNLQTLGGDDTVTTHPLPSTSQILDGGAQASVDTLSYDAGGACTSAGSSTFLSLGGQLVSHAGFETVSLLGQCSGGSPVPALYGVGRAALAALLGAAALWLSRRRQGPPEASTSTPRRSMSRELALPRSARV